MWCLLSVLCHVAWQKQHMQTEHCGQSAFPSLFDLARFFIENTQLWQKNSAMHFAAGNFAGQPSQRQGGYSSAPGSWSGNSSRAPQVPHFLFWNQVSWINHMSVRLLYAAYHRAYMHFWRCISSWHTTAQHGPGRSAWFVHVWTRHIRCCCSIGAIHKVCCLCCKNESEQLAWEQS